MQQSLHVLAFKTCANLYMFINISINQCTNYNTSFITFINTSIVNLQTNLTNITNWKANNAALSVANVVLWANATL